VNPIEIPPGTIEAVGLYAARCGAVILGAPLLGAALGFTMWRAAFIMMLAGTLYAAHGQPLAVQPEPFEYGILIVREIAIGLSLGFCLYGALFAVRTAAELISQEIGLGYAGLVDPSNGASTSSVALFYEIFFYLGLFLTDGHHALFRALAISFDGVPVGEMHFALGIAESALSLLGPMIAAGVAFAAPVMGLLLAASLLIALLGRAVPQLNVNEMGFTLRTVTGLFALFLFAPAMAPALNSIYVAFQVALSDTVRSLSS
jgi:flagellar biosynthetic protein FliR